jgi:hypothetical protein
MCPSISQHQSQHGPCLGTLLILYEAKNSPYMITHVSVLAAIGSFHDPGRVQAMSLFDPVWQSHCSTRILAESVTCPYVHLLSCANCVSKLMHLQ